VDGAIVHGLLDDLGVVGDPEGDRVHLRQDAVPVDEPPHRCATWPESAKTAIPSKMQLLSSMEPDIQRLVST
jgi:hypothetical protein